MENLIRNVLIETERLRNGGKVKIISRQPIGNSDWAEILVEAYRPKCRKPYATWTLTVNFVRKMIDFERSHIDYL